MQNLFADLNDKGPAPFSPLPRTLLTLSAITSCPHAVSRPPARMLQPSSPTLRRESEGESNH
jgi:hypothetical protein